MNNQTSAPKQSTWSGQSMFALLAVIAAFTSGCGTVMNQRTGEHQVYGGVKRDWHDIKSEAAPEGQAIVTAFDLPLSAIADTFCWPFDKSKQQD